MTPAVGASRNGTVPRPRVPGVLRRARQCLLVLLLSAGGTGSLQGQEAYVRMRLFTRTGAPANTPRVMLDRGSTLLVLRDSAPDRVGRTVKLDSVPLSDSLTWMQDSVPAPGGLTGNTYDVNRQYARYLVYARTPGGRLLWSVPGTGSSPRYHTLDDSSLIRMADVRPEFKARLNSLFVSEMGELPPAPDNLVDPNIADTGTTNTSRAGSQGARRAGSEEKSNLLWIAAIVSALVIGWVAGHFRWGRRIHGIARRKREHVNTHGHYMPPLVNQGYSNTSPIATSGGGPHYLRNDDGSPELDDRLNAIVEALRDELDKKFGSLETELGGKLDDIGKRLANEPNSKRSNSPPATHPALEPGRDQPFPADHGSLDTHDGGSPGTGTATNTGDPVASVFVDWCRTAGGNVGRLNLFAESLRSAVRSAEVQVLSRDRNASTLTFVEDGAGDPVEYWMVTLGRESVLLPRPLNPERFRELSPVFNGEATPPTLRSITPAVVIQKGGSWIMETPGWVN